jgi:hypothetical protein
MHIHVVCVSGEAKFWLEPEIELARNHQLDSQQLGEIRFMIEVHKDDFISAWHRHFNG